MGRQRKLAEPEREAKHCRVCGRRVEWRKAWERDWAEVRHCSAGCRRRGLGPVDRALESTILELLAARRAGATICPAEAARAVALPASEVSAAAVWSAAEPWRDLLEPARMAARRLVTRGELEILQGGRVVDPSTARGPVRLRRTADRSGPAR